MQKIKKSLLLIILLSIVLLSCEETNDTQAENFNYLVVQSDTSGNIHNYDVSLYSNKAHKTTLDNISSSNLIAFSNLYYMRFTLNNAASGGSAGIDAGTYTFSSTDAQNKWNTLSGYLDMSVNTTARTIRIGTGIDSTTKTEFESSITSAYQNYTVTTSTYHQITGGTIEVKRTGEGANLTYTFTWKFTTSDGKTHSGSYKGKVDAAS